MGSFPSDGLAVIKQGLLAGRVPGLSDPDEQDRLEDIYKARCEIRRAWYRMESNHSIHIFGSLRLGRGSSINCRSWGHRNRFEICKFSGRLLICHCCTSS